MELSSGVLSGGEYLRAVGRVVELLTAAGVPEVLVAYGFGCDCPDELLYQDVRIASPGLHAFMAEAVAAGYYRVGRDNLHVKTPDGRADFLLCHESDIHLTTEDAGLLDQVRAAWLADGHRQMFEKSGGEWHPVSSPTATGRPPD